MRSNAPSGRSSRGRRCSEFGLLDELVLQSVQAQRFVSVLIGSFAALALAMSMAGVFSVVSYLTSRRHKEIAVRRAVGAGSADVMWLLSAQTFQWTLAGLILGVGGGVARQPRAAGDGHRPCRSGSDDRRDSHPWISDCGGGGDDPAASRALRIDPASALRSE
jgi:hypothetical protein